MKHRYLGQHKRGVLRGGSFVYRPPRLGYTNRYWYARENRHWDDGFRLIVRGSA